MMDAALNRDVKCKACKKTLLKNHIQNTEVCLAQAY